MPAADDFRAVFLQLRDILKQFETRLTIQTDDDDTYYLNGKVLGKNNKPICFGWTAIKKNYVSYHLMPVYGCPQFIEKMSPELRARMQGKACFNFTHVDRKLFRELASLTKAGFNQFRQMGLI